MEQAGCDSDGNLYSSSAQMWELEAGENVLNGTVSDRVKKQEWYRKGLRYWKGVEASVNGLLGGRGRLSDVDVMASDAFLVEVLNENLPEATLPGRRLVALDCGAGVGRVTKDLLLRRFHEVDLVEPVPHFLQAAGECLKSINCSGNQSSDVHTAVNFYGKSLQDFTPEVSRYDVIWVQWCIGHLTDQDFIAFFRRAKAGLKPGGFFVLKEHIVENGFVVDKIDNNVTRSDTYFCKLFQQAGLCLLKSKLQNSFPEDLFAVRMYALTTQPLQAYVPRRTRSKRILNPRLTIL